MLVLRIGVSIASLHEKVFRRGVYRALNSKVGVVKVDGSVNPYLLICFGAASILLMLFCKANKILR